jgi:hypothetical protein
VLGTAFGYGNSPQSPTFDCQNPLPDSCGRWGWFLTPTTGQLSAGISGPLYVGAGQNDINQAIQVGTWSAKLSNGEVSVTYTLFSGYTLSEVHVDLECTPIPTCDPDQYPFCDTNPADLGSPYTVSGLTLPNCWGWNQQIYLIIEAVIDVPANGGSCSPRVAW